MKENYFILWGPAPQEMADWYVVLDFEATCDAGRRPRQYSGDASARDVRVASDQEVIELPSVLVEGATGALVTVPGWGGPPAGPGEFQMYVRPRVHPSLTDFCVNLTGITQDKVCDAPPFAAVLQRFETWLRGHGLLGGDATMCIVTCGDWDMKTMMPRQCYASGIDVPDWAKTWINVKHVFEQCGYARHAGGMMQMLAALGIRHKGRHHSGLDDCRNIALILQRFVADGRWDGRLTAGTPHLGVFQGSPNVAAAPDASKTRRKIIRQLHQIDQLEARVAQGEVLELNQLTKIAHKPTLQQTLASL